MKLQPVIQKLSTVQETFLRAAEHISASNWLAAVSGMLVGGPHCRSFVSSRARRPRLRRPRHPEATEIATFLYKRLHLPLALVEGRLVKRKAPAIVAPQENLANKELMIAELGGVRERTRAFLEETHRRELSEYYWRHPFLGQLNFYDWFAFVAAHQLRHSKQMWEIGQNLPKGVASS